MGQKPHLSTIIKGLISAIGIGIISNLIYDSFQFFSGGTIFQLQQWVTIFFIAFVSSFLTYILFKKTDEPVFELSADLNKQIEEFQKYFNHPNNGIIQNPFDAKPEFWDPFFEISNAFLKRSFIHLKNNLGKSQKHLSFEELEQYSLDFCYIIETYLKITEIFRNVTRKYPLSEGIKEQYNEKFVTEFNTITRPDLIKYIAKLEEISGKELGIIKNIQTVSPL